MSAFLNGLGFGFANGMMNNMFGFCRPFGFGGFGWGMPMCPPPPPMMGFCGGFSNIFMPVPMMTVNCVSSNYDVFEKHEPNVRHPHKNEETETVSKTETKVNLPDENISDEAIKLYEKWCVKQGVEENSDLSHKFCQKVIDISKKVKCKPNDLMAIMYVESRFHHGKKVNKRTEDRNPEVGLIQFDKAFRNPEDDEYGITMEQILGMSAIKQLDLVEKRILGYRKEKNIANNDKLELEDLADMICQTEGNETLYAKKGTNAYNKNSSFDNEEKEQKVTVAGKEKSITKHIKDGKITKDELIKGLKTVKENR